MAKKIRKRPGVRENARPTGDERARPLRPPAGPRFTYADFPYEDRKGQYARALILQAQLNFVFAVLEARVIHEDYLRAACESSDRMWEGWVGRTTAMRAKMYLVQRIQESAQLVSSGERGLDDAAAVCVESFTGDHPMHGRQVDRALVRAAVEAVAQRGAKWPAIAAAVRSAGLGDVRPSSLRYQWAARRRKATAERPNLERELRERIAAGERAAKLEQSIRQLPLAARQEFEATLALEWSGDGWIWESDAKKPRGVIRRITP